MRHAMREGTPERDYLKPVPETKKKGPEGPFPHQRERAHYWPGQMPCSSWLKLSSFLTEPFLGAPK